MNADKCSACRGQCCYGALVRLSWDDVRRVGRSQHLDFASFAQMVVDEGRTSQEFALAFGLGPHAEPHLLALRHSSRVANACAFLVLVAGQPCGIYEDRPAVCRVYPMRRSGAGIAVRDDVICRPHDWDRARFDPAPYVDAIGLQHCEWRTFERTVAVWNRTLAGRGGATADAFVAYLDATYARIDRTRAALGEGDYRRLVDSWHDDGPASAVPRAAFLETIEHQAQYALNAIAVA